MSDQSNPCPVCLQHTASWARLFSSDASKLSCRNCGVHLFSGSVFDPLVDLPSHNAKEAARIAHSIHKVPPATLITSPQWEAIRCTASLAGAAECIDNLLAYMATAGGPGSTINLEAVELLATIGVDSLRAVDWVVAAAHRAGLITFDDRSPAIRQLNPLQGLSLSPEGWHRHEAKLKDGADSKHAFMAMRYSADMQRVFLDHLVPAVAETGFELRTANGPHQPAGSIDDRMRVEIRTSRFMVCDISDGNRGAYWEAGFAEGIGRPVFYVCRADVLSDPKHEHHPHFDTRQSLIVPWDPQDMGPGMLKLKQAIRATLPHVARMED